MISPPTDRLHKFLAIGGLVLMGASLSISLQRHHEAETQRIEAYAKVQEAGFAYQRYAGRVNQMIGIRNDATSRELEGAELAKAKDKIRTLDPEAEQIAVITERILVDASKHSQLAAHLEWTMKVWVVLGIFGGVIGATISFVGFRQWAKLPQHER